MRDIGTTPLLKMMRAAGAILDLVWRDEAANVRALRGLPGMDCLLCEVAIRRSRRSPRWASTALPSYFTSFHHRDGARPSNPSALVEQGQDVTVPLTENWWAVYYDEIFDVAKGEGEGPCSMLIAVPAEGQIRFAPGSYAVGTNISLPAETRTVRMAFWDHQGMTNAEARALVAEQAPAVRELLHRGLHTRRDDFDVAEAGRRWNALASEAARRPGRPHRARCRRGWK